MDTNSPPTPISLARVIARRAVDLLAISVVAVCGLSAGQQIIAWWRADSSGPSLSAGAVDPQIHWSGRPLELQFGDSSTGLQRIPFTGTRDAAEQQLIRLARAALLESTDALPPPTNEEAAWITALEKRTPEESQPDLGNIYLAPGLLPSVAATKSSAVRDVAQTSSRLVVWGLATPQGERTWTLMLFRTTSVRPEASIGEIALPPGAETLLAWQDRAGNRVVSFRGRATLEAWRQHFERQCATFSAAGQETGANRAAGRWQTSWGAVDVQFTKIGNEITGLLWITRPVQGHNGNHEKSQSK